MNLSHLFIASAIFFSAASNASGFLTSDSPCIVNPDAGETLCQTSITFNKGAHPVACIWVDNPLRIVTCQGHQEWNTVWNWTNPSGRFLELRGHANFPTSHPYWPRNMKQDYLSSSYIDKEFVFASIQSEKPKNIAHRGHSYSYLENSILAFIGAAWIGADMVELDVRITSDGTPIIYHDSTLNRLVECDANNIIGSQISNLDFHTIRDHCRYKSSLVSNAGTLPQGCLLYEPTKILNLKETLSVLECLQMAALIEAKDIGSSAVIDNLAEHAETPGNPHLCSTASSCFSNIIIQSFSQTILTEVNRAILSSHSQSVADIRLVRLIGKNQAVNLTDHTYSNLWAWDGVAFDHTAFEPDDLVYAINLMRINNPEKWIATYTISKASILSTLERSSLNGIITSRPHLIN